VPDTNTYPGVYVEEEPSRPHEIVGVTNLNKVFIGTATDRPLNQALTVNGLNDFAQQFGNLAPDQELGYAILQFFLNGGDSACIVRASGISDNAFLESLQAIDNLDAISLLAIPGVSSTQVVSAAANYCQNRRAFLLVDPPGAAETPASLKALLENGSIPRTSYGSVYYPWITIADPLNPGHSRAVAPSGTIAGIISRTDQAGIWKAPAGPHALPQGAQGLAYELTDDECNNLNSAGINCLRKFSQSGLVIWGARTLEGSDGAASDWKYISVRRTALFIEKSVYEGIQWVVFEPNNETLWAKLISSISRFLESLWKQGALYGQTSNHAYVVKCDSQTMTQSDIDNGLVNISIGVALLKPAEFIWITIQQKAS
jgi:phage tail sheath protein FI